MSLAGDRVDVTVVEQTGLVDRPVSWRAVFAGVAIALVVQLVLSILGAAIGLAFIDPRTADGSSAGYVALAAMIWWTLSGILAAWAGGVTAGRLSGRPGTETAAWHGLVAWAASILVVFYLISAGSGSILRGAFNVVGTVAGGAAGAAADAVPGTVEAADPFAVVQTELDNATAGNDPAAARFAAAGLVRAAFTAADADAPAAMDRAAQALARASGTKPEAARETLTSWKASYDRTVADAQAAAVEAADRARRAASLAGILSVVALAFGAAAGWFGGWSSQVAANDTPLSRISRRVTSVR